MYQTTEKQKSRVHEIAKEVLEYEEDFFNVEKIKNEACVSEGVYDLMELWSEEKNKKEKHTIFIELCDLIT